MWAWAKGDQKWATMIRDPLGGDTPISEGATPYFKKATKGWVPNCFIASATAALGITQPENLPCYDYQTALYKSN